MLIIALTILHVLIAVFLILVVLVQSGKGSDIGAAFGGGASQTVFGARGATTVLHKLTSGLAAGFMVTSLVLAVLAGHRVSRSVIPDEPATPAPQSSAPVGAPPGTPAGEQKAPPAAAAPGGQTSPGASAPGQATPSAPPAEPTKR